jgi:hypothetical protein
MLSFSLTLHSRFGGNLNEVGENVAGVDYHQYLGLFDALGQLNAWGHWPEYWPPTWHSTNPVLPPAMAVGEMTSESVRD